MSEPTTLDERVYGALVRLFPRPFGDEHGDALAQFFRDDVRERGRGRGWGRALSDLLVSVPVRHVEVTVSGVRQRTRVRTLWMLGAPVVAGLVAVSLGRFVVLIVPIAFGVSVATYLSSMRSYDEAVAGASGGWWRALGAGVLLLAGMGVRATYGPGMDWFPWPLAVLLYVVACGLVVSGALLGLLHLYRARRRRPAAI